MSKGGSWRSSQPLRTRRDRSGRGAGLTVASTSRTVPGRKLAEHLPSRIDNLSGSRADSACLAPWLQSCESEAPRIVISSSSPSGQRRSRPWGFPPTPQLPIVDPIAVPEAQHRRCKQEMPGPDRASRKKKGITSKAFWPTARPSPVRCRVRSEREAKPVAATRSAAGRARHPARGRPGRRSSRR